MAAVLILPSRVRALKTLRQLRREIAMAPSFESLERIRRTARAVQREFRDVKDVSDEAGVTWSEAEIKLREKLEEHGLAKGTRGQLAGKKKGTGRGKGKGRGTSSGGTKSEPPEETKPTLAELGIDKHRASTSKQLSAIPKKDRGRIIRWLKKEGKGVTPQAIIKKHKEELREAKRQSYAKRASSGGKVDDLRALAADDKRFSVIYADPPWTFENYSGKGKQRSAERHYDTMSLAAIAALPVKALAAEHCALFLWAVWPELPGALGIIESWGFTYKTAGFIYVKQNRSGKGFFTGMGYWTRANTEPCLFATKGSPTRLARNVPQLLIAPRGRHSTKPEEAAKRIERLLPGPYLELFARKPRAKWTAWGNEIAPQQAEAAE